MITENDLQLEYQIIGSFIMDDSAHMFIEHLKVDDFIDGACKQIFEVMQRLKMENKDISLFSLNDATEKENHSWAYLAYFVLAFLF